MKNICNPIHFTLYKMTIGFRNEARVKVSEQVREQVSNQVRERVSNQVVQNVKNRIQHQNTLNYPIEINQDEL